MSPLTELNNIPHRFPQDKVHTCIQVPNTAKPGYSPIYRNAASPNELVGSFKGLTTLHELFANAVNLFGNDNCLGERLYNPKTGLLNNYYTYQTYNQIDQRRLDVASGLIKYMLDNYKNTSDIIDPVSKKPNFTVSVSGFNSIEMLVLDLATRSFSIPNTGLYESLTDESSLHIFEITKSPILFLNKHLLQKYLDLAIKNKSKLKLRMFVTFESLEEIPENLISKVRSNGLQIVDFNTIENLGSQNRLPSDYNLPTPDTLYTLAFTSGTTGLPKGVYLTHENATANVIGFFVHVPKPSVGLSFEKSTDFSYNKDSRGEQLKTICFLPLLHNYEKSITNFEMSYGIALALPSKRGTASLFEDLKIIRPSLFTGVPRIFTLVENEIKRRIKNSGITDLDKQSEFIINDLGFENVSYLQCASAPISRESIIYFKKILKCGFLNSYGATELFSVMSYSDPYDKEILSGSSGVVAVSCEIRLKDVQEMGYTSNDTPFPRGEVLVRGKCRFSHYFENKKATKEAIDEEGWYHSGDVAAVDRNGNLFIIDRVKNFFKLSQGEYVTPERVETIYLAKNPMLTQLFVHGDSYTNYLVGIAGIDIKGIKAFLQEAGLIKGEIGDGELLALLKDSKVKKYLLDHLSLNIKDSNLKGYEKIHNIHFAIEPLSIENESLTPSFKLKRNGARKAHEDRLKDLYKEGSLLKRNAKL